jgi:hypothetical protein
MALEAMLGQDRANPRLEELGLLSCDRSPGGIASGRARLIGCRASQTAQAKSNAQKGRHPHHDTSTQSFDSIERLSHTSDPSIS